MKTSENKLNEALRSALKRKFDNFENAPDPSAFEKIRANIKPAPQWRYLFYSLLFIGIAITGIVADQHFMQNSVGKSEITHSDHAKNSVIKLPVGETPVIKSLALKTALVEPASEEPASVKRALVKPASVEPTLSKQEVIKNLILANQSIVRNSDNADQNSSAASKDEANDQSSNSYRHETLPSETDGELSASADMIDNQQFEFTINHSALPGIQIPKADIKPVVRTRADQLNWLVNAAVLQSYQILTVPAGGQSFQNFEFPSTFSLRSLGYKFSVGAEKKGFQLMLHYSRFQQSYSYEIAGNDYIVHNLDQGKFVVIRQGTRVNQENKFSLLGIGVNKHVQWGNASVGKYYASAGLEYSYGMVRKQSIGWVNAGIGKQFPINKNATLNIGPYAEFSPVKFAGSGDPFFYQPYRVGVSAGLRLGR